MRAAAPIARRAVAPTVRRRNRGTNEAEDKRLVSRAHAVRHAIQRTSCLQLPPAVNPVRSYPTPFSAAAAQYDRLAQCSGGVLSRRNWCGVMINQIRRCAGAPYKCGGFNADISSRRC